VEKPMFVMDDVVNTVGRYEVTRLITDISQALPLSYPT
jgi:hypothetical protein